MVGCSVGVLPATGVVSTSCIVVTPPSMRGTSTSVAAARPWAPLGLCLVFSRPSLV